MVYMKLNFLFFFFRIFMQLKGSVSSGHHNPISTVLGFALKEIT